MMVKANITDSSLRKDISGDVLLEKWGLFYTNYIRSAHQVFSHQCQLQPTHIN